VLGEERGILPRPRTDLQQPTTVLGLPHQERGPLGELPRRLAHLVAMVGARLVGGKQAVPDLPEAASGKVSGIC
jgi:hypothetical protein